MQKIIIKRDEILLIDKNIYNYKIFLLKYIYIYIFEDIVTNIIKSLLKTISIDIKIVY